jgi:hypothetical protein
MKVWIDVGDSRAELGNDGIILHVADNSGKKDGRLRAGRATVEWCGGKTQIGNGRKMRIDDLISYLGGPKPAAR